MADVLLPLPASQVVQAAKENTNVGHRELCGTALRVGAQDDGDGDGDLFAMTRDICYLLRKGPCLGN